MENVGLGSGVEEVLRGVDETRIARKSLHDICGLVSVDLEVVGREEENCGALSDGLIKIEKKTIGVAVVVLCFENEESAQYFCRQVIEKDKESFENIQLDGCNLRFDLTVTFLSAFYDMSNRGADMGLIEKYGGKSALLKYLYEIIKGESLSVCDFVLP